MEQSIIDGALERIRRMELRFDTLQEAVDANPAEIRQDASLEETLKVLTQYYEGGQWLRDYELDEKGLLPKDLKRGVLSQDALYDLLAGIRDADCC